ncbi:hypothetical protein V3C99_010428 [Haemonchus contortus]|uniref:Amastin n=1 Tax=Haemonchus contortus TaxID=6289 RepID=A0A7I4YFG0_HAECO
MCIFSACGQIVFGSIMVLCLILTAVAAFDGKLVPWNCLTDEDVCNPWEKAQKDFLIAVAVLLCLAILFQLLSLAWNIFTFWACCCKKYVIHPLMGLSLLVAIFLLAAVIVYVVMTQDEARGLITYRHNAYGYTFWLAVAALILALIDTVVAGVTVCVGEQGL